MRKTLITAGSLAGSIVAIYTALQLLGIDAPVPALKTDIQEVREYAQSVDQTATENALESIQLRLYRNLDRQEEYRQKGESIPPHLRNEQVSLENKKRRLERRLNAIQE